jgi:sigma-54-specific transcriptional regulator
MTTSLPIWPFAKQVAPTEESGWILQDPASQALQDVIHQIAPSEASVVIYGEGGADKELIARYIHENSPRRHGPFVKVNCGALSETLINDELFGHESGAFAGAFGSLPGRFEDAHGGTLWLDEIDDLPQAMQTKLVRVLQEKTVMRLGASARVNTDVRVLASSLSRLEHSVVAKRFREDLYYLLNVVALDVLPLRERPGDILPLARHFIHEYASRLNYVEVALSTDAEKKLLQHTWPGNVRELENVIHRTLLLSRGLKIQAADLHLPVLLPAARVVSGVTAGEDDSDVMSDVQLAEAFDGACERHKQGLELIVQNTLLLTVWERNRFNQVHTAKQLGISRSVVRARLIRLGKLSSSAETTDGHKEEDHATGNA